MNNEQVFLAWAPAQSRWSDWVKPVAFAQAAAAGTPVTAMPSAPAPGSTPQDPTISGSPVAGPGATVPLTAAPDTNVPSPIHWQSLPMDWLPAPSDTAIVVNQPGPASVATGLAMAHRGYRPVPLFNACTGPSEIINMQQVIRALFEAARELADMNIPQHAPPAFLLDSERLQGGNAVQPGRFDNRWMVFPQDFPSANLLLSERIRRVLFVHNGPATMPEDLAHVLLRWQQAGLEILSQDTQDTGPSQPQPLQVKAPLRFKSLWYRLLAMMGLRRNSAGGFGSVIPVVQPGVG